MLPVLRDRQQHVELHEPREPLDERRTVGARVGRIGVGQDNDVHVGRGEDHRLPARNVRFHRSGGRGTRESAGEEHDGVHVSRHGCLVVVHSASGLTRSVFNGPSYERSASACTTDSFACFRA